MPTRRTITLRSGNRSGLLADQRGQQSAGRKDTPAVPDGPLLEQSLEVAHPLRDARVCATGGMTHDR